VYQAQSSKLKAQEKLQETKLQVPLGRDSIHSKAPPRRRAVPSVNQFLAEKGEEAGFDA